MPVTAIELNSAFIKKHQRVLVKYVFSPNAMSRAERNTLLQAIDAVRYSRVKVDGRDYTFAQFYNLFIDKAYADEFIDELWAAEQVENVGRQKKAQVTKAIRERFIREGWYRHDLPKTRLLLAFCLFWWASFATGYIFEVKILRDLCKSGIDFHAHDVTQRTERYAFADLTISGMMGDIKSSAYFFFTARSADLPHDFYISRYYDEHARRYQHFVIIKAEHWQLINGDVIPIVFPNWRETLLHPARFDFAGIDFVAVDYEGWKEKILRYQLRKVKEYGSQNDR